MMNVADPQQDPFAAREPKRHRRVGLEVQRSGLKIGGGRA